MLTDLLVLLQHAVRRAALVSRSESHAEPNLRSDPHIVPERL